MIRYRLRFVVEEGRRIPMNSPCSKRNRIHASFSFFPFFFSLSVSYPEKEKKNLCLGQFFDKITIKAEKKDDAKEEDDSGYQSDKQIVWEDVNYVKADVR
jgi:hypothetical protein